MRFTSALTLALGLTLGVAHAQIVPDPPTISAPDHAHVGESILFDIYHGESPGVLALTVSSGTLCGTSNCRFTAAGRTIHIPVNRSYAHWRPDTVGRQTATITTSDAALSATAVITVLEAGTPGSPPTLTAMPRGSVTAGTVITLTTVDYLNWFKTGGDWCYEAECTFTSSTGWNNEQTVYWRASSAGTYTIYGVDQDDGVTALTITVTAPPPPAQ